MNISAAWFSNKKITLMGLGLHGGGLAVAQWLLKQGSIITVTDQKTLTDLQTSVDILQKTAVALGVENNLHFCLGRHDEVDFVGVDMIIKNPGVRNDNKFLQIARDNQILVYDEAMLFMSLVKVLVIGITGSKGKSTTTSLIGQMLQTKYPKILIAGNIRSTALFQIIDQVITPDSDVSMVVVEFSSWQLDNFGDIAISPQIGVITNLLPEHLNSYNNSFTDYIQSKFNIVKFQKSDNKDVAVLNYDDVELNKFGTGLTGLVIWFSIQTQVPHGIEIRHTNQMIWHENGTEKKLGDFTTTLIGDHNLANIAAAVSVAYMQGVAIEDIIRVLQNFQTLSGRREYLGDIVSRHWYNDTTATAPVAVQALLESFSQSIVLIAGGSDKGSPLVDLADTIIQKVTQLILLPGDGSTKLVSELKKLNFVNVIQVETMEQAVTEAVNHSRAGDNIVLSPGFASFASFKHEFDRGEAFVKAVKLL